MTTLTKSLEADQVADGPDLDFQPAPEVDCTKCGACCSHVAGSGMVAGSAYVELLHGDLVNLGLDVEGRHKHLVVARRGAARNTSGYHLRVIDAQDILRETDVRCPFLAGDVGLGVCCTVYERRPYACRRYEPGTQACTKARQQHYEAGHHGSLRPTVLPSHATARAVSKAAPGEGILSHEQVDVQLGRSTPAALKRTDDD